MIFWKNSYRRWKFGTFPWKWIRITRFAIASFIIMAKNISLWKSVVLYNMINNIIIYLDTSRRFWNFSMILTTFFTLLFDPSKWVWPRLAKNLNCKYNYLIPRIQLSRKNWVGRSLGLNKWGLRRKIARFFEFRNLMSHRGKGVPHIGKFCIPNNSLWFVYQNIIVIHLDHFWN